MHQGTIEITIDGKVTSIGPGSIAYIHSNALHGARNAGSTPVSILSWNLTRKDESSLPAAFAKLTPKNLEEI